MHLLYILLLAMPTFVLGAGRQDFSGTAVDTNTWLFDGGYKYNNEDQWYIYGNDNRYAYRIDLGGGNYALRIHAKSQKSNCHANNWNNDWSRNPDCWISARLVAKPGSNMILKNGGKITYRARLGTNQPGFFPSTWLLPLYDNWPFNGEIDVMEYNVGMFGWNRFNHGVVVTNCWNGGCTNDRVGNFQFQAQVPNSAITAWHEFTCEWAGDTIRFKVDGNLVYSISRTTIVNSNSGYQRRPDLAWPFTSGINGNGFKAILNVAMNPYSQRAAIAEKYWMDIDWVQIWDSI